MIAIGGYDAGIGRALVGLALIDYLLDKKRNIAIIDAGVDNIELLQICGPVVSDSPAIRVQLHDKDGWLQMVNFMDDVWNADVIIDLDECGEKYVKQFGELLNADPVDLNRRFLTFWSFGRDPEGFALLKQYMDVMTNSEIYALRNYNSATRDVFRMYNTSALKDEVARRGKTYDFPELAYYIASFIVDNDLNIADVFDNVPLDERREMERWRAECARIFDEVLDAQ